jgi:hypothetical protein
MAVKSSLPYTGPNLRVGGVITRTPFTVASNSPKVGKIGDGFLQGCHRPCSHPDEMKLFIHWLRFFTYIIFGN